MGKDFSVLYNMSETMTILADLKQDGVLKNLCGLLEILTKYNAKDQIYPEALKYYSNMCTALFNADKSASLPNYLYDLVLYSTNSFSKLCSQNRFHEISSYIIEAVKHDIKTIRLISEIPCAELTDKIIKNITIL